MKRFSQSVCALAATLLPAAAPAAEYDILASVFQFAPPGEMDPAPGLSGIIRVDPETGAASQFIPEDFNVGMFVLSDVAVGPHDGMVYVASAASGVVARYGADGAFAGVAAAFALPDESPDGVSRLRFANDGTLFVSTQSGVVAEFDPSGVRQADRATGLDFPAGLAVSPAGDVYVVTGSVGAGSGGSVLRLTGGAPETVIAAGEGIGGASGLTYRSAIGDYNGDEVTDQADLGAWKLAYGSPDTAADGNGDGVVDAADYVLWRNHLGDEAQLLVADFDQSPTGNEIYAYDLVSEVGGTLTTIPVPIPDLPPEIMPVPTNVPSEIVVTPEGTLLVSTLGPSQRPFNNAALLEFDLDGSLIRRIDNQPDPQTGLPPLSGIALLPTVGVAAGAVPEPTTLALIAGVVCLAAAGGRR